MPETLIYIGIGLVVTSVAALGLTVLAAIAIVFISGTDSYADDLDYDFED
jgi:hypothetical protein